MTQAEKRMTEGEKAEAEHRILSTLSEEGALMTGTVARQVEALAWSNKGHSAQVRRLILGLKDRGLVTELDTCRPVAWRRTAKGTRELVRLNRQALSEGA